MKVHDSRNFVSKDRLLDYINQHIDEEYARKEDEMETLKSIARLQVLILIREWVFKYESD